MESLKKDPPVFERSIMLTRFKLSQQKRQLREKDNTTITNVLKKSPKTKKQKSPVKSKEKSQNNDNEFHPNKLKRNKVVKKIVLKPKNDLKVIDWNGVKRKRQEIIPDIKPLNIKSKKSKDSNDRLSPVYSELDFDEVIQMADDELDDEDLMEILTCPSPVWWEDPPDSDYVEGPIMIKTNTLASITDLTKHRRKQARKRTPQKIIIEKEDTINSIQDNLQNKLNNNTFDVKFKNKRNKLESLLNTMKNKKEIKQPEDDNKEELIKNVEIKENPETMDLSGDSTYLDITLLDKNILEHLENIKIPIQDIEPTNKKVITSSKRKYNKHKAFYTRKTKNTEENNEKIGSEDIIISNNKIPIPREDIRYRVVTPLKNKRGPKKKPNSMKKSQQKSNNDFKNNFLSNNITSGIKDDLKNDEEYITVFEIINSDDETDKKTEKIDIKSELKTDIILEGMEQNQLNSYYKKIKNSSKKISQKKSNDKVKEKCNDSNIDDKYSIIVPTTKDIKYCLKCSSIFDADICSYCIKKEEIKKETNLDT